MDRSSLTLLLARGQSVAKIAKQFGKHPSTVSYWMAKYDLQATGRQKHSGKGGIERQRLEALVQAGMTIAQIAVEVGLSQGAVRHWMARYGLRSHRAAGRRPPEVARAGRDAGQLT